MSISQKKEEKFIIIALVIEEIVNLFFWNVLDKFKLYCWCLNYNIYIFIVLESFSIAGLAPWKERSD